MTREFQPSATQRHLYPESRIGGFSRTDGQVEFYTRINALVDESSRVLDLGAGRAQWAVDPMPATAVKLRLLRGRVEHVVGADLDPVVLENHTVDEAVVLDDPQRLPFASDSFDLVLVDHVLEHVRSADREAFIAEISRVVRIGGWVAGRTPHKWGVIGIGARVIPNSWHVRVLRRLQPDRLPEDVFPVEYALNTQRTLRRMFPAPRFDTCVYGHFSEPAYFGNSVVAWRMAAAANRLTPPQLAPIQMVFSQRLV